MKTPFIWLGSGRSRKWDCGEKAKLLDQAAKAGLPVPPGAVLLDEFFQLLLMEGVIVEQENGRFAAADPGWLAETLFEGVRFPRLDKPVAVRTAFSYPHDEKRIEVRDKPPQLDVDLTDPAQLSNSLCELWSSKLPKSARRDLIIMEMAQSQIIGTAQIETDEASDVVRFHGEASSPVHHLRPLRTWQRPDTNLPPRLQRLQRLLRGIRRSFGKRNWHIDWLDDSRICWLLQVTHGK